jgi:hypothetical protein
MPPEAVQLRVTDGAQKPQTSIDQPVKLLSHRFADQLVQCTGLYAYEIRALIPYNLALCVI